MPVAGMNIRMDSEVKREAQELFAEFGLDMTTAINIFLRQAIRERALPFEIRMTSEPDAQTKEAIREGERILKSGKSRFKDANEMSPS